MSDPASEGSDGANKIVQVTYLKNFGLKFGVRPNNVLTPEKARALFEKGKKFSLLFGDPTNPSHHIEVFQRIPDKRQRIDVHFYADGKDAGNRILVFEPEDFGDPRPEMLMVEAVLALGGGMGRAKFFISDVFVDGDLPRLTLSDNERHAISVPWQDFYIGPIPTFDELISGAFVARLPTLTLPPRDLLEEYRPQIDRKPTDPKRIPSGRFPW